MTSPRTIFFAAAIACVAVGSAACSTSQDSTDTASSTPPASETTSIENTALGALACEDQPAESTDAPGPEQWPPVPSSTDPAATSPEGIGDRPCGQQVEQMLANVQDSNSAWLCFLADGRYAGEITLDVLDPDRVVPREEKDQACRDMGYASSTPR